MHASNSRRLSTDLARLAALCLGVFFLGLTTHGITNWQEGQRALVAREMAAARDGRTEWIVPTVHGTPYLAKPPLIYWAQLGIAKATGSAPTLGHLRFTVALATTAAVFLTYFATRRMLAPERPAPGAEAPHGSAAPGATDPHQAAWWAAAFLGTGFLAVRSGRIGELDALLMPFAVGGIWALFEAWMLHRRAKRTHWLALGLAALCAAGAALTKGPPGLLVILLGAYGGMLLRAAWTPPLVDSPAERWLPASAASITAVAVLAARAGDVRSLPDALGLALLALLAAAPAALLARSLETRRLGMTWAAWTRTHPIGVALAGLLPLLAWSRLVASRTDPAVVARAADAEAADNLNLFVPESPLANLEAMSYGVGLGSIAALAAMVWLVRKRPALPPGVWMVLAWVGLGLAAFSLLGKGVPRYLTPLWPGVAILGGWRFAAAIRNVPIGPRLARIGMVSIATLAAGQALWYGFGRELFFAERSPRAFLAELLNQPGADPGALIAIDFWHPATDYAAGQLIEPYTLTGPETSFAFGPARSLDDLRAELRARSGPLLALVRAHSHPSVGDPSPIDRLRAQGFILRPLELDARFAIDNARTTMLAAWLSLPPAPPPHTPAAQSAPPTAPAPDPAAQPEPEP